MLIKKEQICIIKNRTGILKENLYSYKLPSGTSIEFNIILNAQTQAQVNFLKYLNGLFNDNIYSDWWIDPLKLQADTIILNSYKELLLKAS